jgi:hypothetical protein
VVTNGLTVAITGAHLPRAPSGTAGGVVTNLSTLISGTKITGSMAVPAELKDSLEILVKTGQIYLNLHTAANAGGEVRGQALASQDLYFDGGYYYRSSSCANYDCKQRFRCWSWLHQPFF